MRVPWVYLIQARLSDVLHSLFQRIGRTHFAATRCAGYSGTFAGWYPDAIQTSARYHPDNFQVNRQTPSVYVPHLPSGNC